MNKKGIGIILIILGCYLLVGNTLFSLYFNYAGPIGFAIPISPADYWVNWWNNYGLTTVIVAVGGLLLLLQGVRVLISYKKGMLMITESN